MPHLNNFISLTGTVLGLSRARAQHRFAGYAARVEVLLGPISLPAYRGLREEHTVSSMCAMYVPLAAALIKESLWQ